MVFFSVSLAMCVSVKNAWNLQGMEGVVTPLYLLDAFII